MVSGFQNIGVLLGIIWLSKRQENLININTNEYINGLHGIYYSLCIAAQRLMKISERFDYVTAKNDDWN